MCTDLKESTLTCCFCSVCDGDTCYSVRRLVSVTATRVTALGDWCLWRRHVLQL